ncbi:hypothetical protein [Leuconostoc falkenbergense]|uniref:hypothetical protein n=1 Tax=Leuconostoc falkenbergense TaxID=2766470 RepID=UPI0024A8AF2E|nr:hypothetical protein [Leuconostoc falkenbergense]MDI6552294.1 hypothetical protein [Leuconostoc falkenbergense]
MNLHTLGPIGTDSQIAATHYMTNQTLILHDTFEEILTHLSDFSGDELIMPVAFKSNQEQNLNWVDFNYLSWENITVRATFSLPLMPLIVVENLAYQRNIALTHAATEGLMKRYLTKVGLDDAWGPSVIFSPSKMVAMTDFIHDQDRLTIISADQFNKLPESRDSRYVVRQTLKPPMIWVVYHIN